MRKPSFNNSLFLVLLLTALLMSLVTSQACRAPSEEQETSAPTNQTSGGEGSVLVTSDLNLDFSKHKVTFIELGADRCIPCKAMQPIMKEIAKEYTGKIQVVFYDVWKDPRPARKYGIQLIPTQVFIDQNDKEIFRHVGYFPKEGILQMLNDKGIL
ncbi:MAG: thioredoxin family protein [Candidatus Aminicenantales bacterium]